MSRVLIIDEDPAARVGYRRFLTADPRISEIGDAASEIHALESLRNCDWDLALLRIRIANGCFDTLERIVWSHPAVPVLAICPLSDPRQARHALRAGARGYLLRGDDPGELAKAVQVVLGGRRYVSPALAGTMTAELAG